MWVRCAKSYQSHVEPGYEVRNSDSLRAKFKALRLVKKPTGDPVCPPKVVRAKRLMGSIENKMGVTDFDDDALLNEIETNKSSKKYVELDNESSSSSDIMDGDLDIGEVPTQSLISPPVQLTTSSSSNVSSSANAIGYKRVGVTESDARKTSLNLATKKRRLLEDQLENKKTESKQRQSTFESYLINQEENIKLEREIAEKREERQSSKHNR